MKFGYVGGVAAAVLFVMSPAAASATPDVADLPSPSERCQIDEPGLTELSGLASDGASWYAVSDGGSSLQVYELDPADCSVRDVRTSATDPYDIEDLALAGDGTVWLADTGDNRRQRDTVALHALPASGGSTLYRMTYPDGPHDAEALLLDRAGVPYIVTKEPFGLAGVYRPEGRLAAGQTVPLTQVGSLSFRPTRTPGGPIRGQFGSILVTGGAMNQAGTVIAIRTYTEAYLYSVPNGDVIAALRQDPLRLPLPGEPQGEAVAWEPDGTLLSGSEELFPVRSVRGVAQAVRTHQEPLADPESSDRPPGGDLSGGNASQQNEQDPRPPGQTLLIAAGIAALVVFAGAKLRRSR